MIGVSLLETSLRGTNVDFCSLIGGDFSLVYYGCFLADARERAITWYSAIAFRCRLILKAVVAEYSPVVLGNKSVNTWHAAVAQLDGILVKNFVKPVFFAEVFVEEA